VTDPSTRNPSGRTGRSGLVPAPESARGSVTPLRIDQPRPRPPEARPAEARAPEARKTPDSKPGGLREVPGHGPIHGSAQGATASGAAEEHAYDSGLVIRSLMKKFKKRPVLRGVSVSLRRGEAVGLLGPNGAGKTTCFYIITGLVRADAGTIGLDGYDITDLPMYRRARLGIGYLPQEASIFRGMSVEQNIRSVLEIVEPERSRREARLDELLDEFSIAHLRKAPALALSGGERRRCEIARALAAQPAFMLLDEPLAGIDPIAVGDIRDLVSHLKDRGIGVLITDHNVRETLEIVDRAYILHEGQVLREGSPADIVMDEDVRRVYLGERFSL
jgi:lipopolysaccharide export system ATP-binding protein